MSELPDQWWKLLDLDEWDEIYAALTDSIEDAGFDRRQARQLSDAIEKYVDQVLDARAKAARRASA